MQLKDIGEHEMIKRLFKIYSSVTEDTTNLFPNDDCAVLDLGDHYLLATSDIISERTHIPRGTTGSQLGWFLMGINLSDLAAKGATPYGFLTAMALPPKQDVEFIEDIGNGMASCSKVHNCPIIGGDTKSSPELTLAGTAIGMVLKEQYMPRKGCSSGDVIAVTGDLGRSGFALDKLEGLGPGGHSSAIQKLYLKLILEVKPRLLAGQMLSKLGTVRSSIDLSDGLGIALHQLAEQNDVGFMVELDKIPRVPMLEKSEAKINEKNLEDILLYAGGDYELLIALPEKKFKKARTAMELLGIPLTIIGEAMSSKELIFTNKEGSQPLENKGFEHFK